MKKCKMDILDLYTAMSIGMFTFGTALFAVVHYNLRGSLVSWLSFPLGAILGVLTWILMDRALELIMKIERSSK